MAPPRKPIDLKVVHALAQAQCTHEEIARIVGMAPPNFSRRFKKDKALQETIEGGYTGGKVSARREMFRAMFDHYLTICKDCDKISVEVNELHNKCEYCGSESVKHKIQRGDHTLMIFWAKNHLGMRDKVELAGDQLSPIRMDVTIESPTERLARYKKYFENPDATDRPTDPLSGRDGSGQPLLQAEADKKAD